MPIKYFRPGTTDEYMIQEDIFDLARIGRFQPKQKSIIIDGGAHIGTKTIQMAEFFKNVEFYSFEPQPENYDLLVKNTKDFANIFPRQEGLGVANERLKLYTCMFSPAMHTIVSPDASIYCKLSNSHSQDSYRLVNPHSQDNYCVIDVINTNDFILSLEQEVFIFKLDLEGYEAKIINDNLTAEALKKIKVLLIEQHYNFVDYQKLIDNGFVFHGSPNYRHDLCPLGEWPTLGMNIQSLFVREEPFVQKKWVQCSMR